MKLFYKFLFRLNILIAIIILILLICEFYSETHNINTKKISNSYYYTENFIDNKNAIYSTKKNKKDIIGEILDYNIGKEYILVLQKPDWDIYNGFDRYFNGSNDTNKYPILDRYFENITLWFEYANEKLNKDSFMSEVLSQSINYFIIIKKNDSLIGPMDYDEYKLKLVELNIPKKLKIGTAEEFENQSEVPIIITALLFVECLLYWSIYLIYNLIYYISIEFKKVKKTQES